MLPEPTIIYPPTPNTIPMDPLNLAAASAFFSSSHLIPNPQIQDLAFADSFSSQPGSPSSSALFELYTNTEATVPTSASTLADEKDNITSAPTSAFSSTTTPTNTTNTTTTTTAATTTTTSTPNPITTTAAASCAAAAGFSSAVGSGGSSSIGNPLGTFVTDPNQFFTTAPSPQFNTNDTNAIQKPTFSSAPKPAFTPRTINPIATSKSRAFKITKARAKSRIKAYKARRNIPHLDTPYLHIPGDPVPPLPPRSIHMYADSRLALAQVTSARLSPMQEITRMYFNAYHGSEETAWGGREGTELAEEKERFKDEFLEHVQTFIPQIEALKGFIELGRKDIGKARTDFLLKGVEAIRCYMKEMKGPKAKEPLREDDMMMLHKMCGQFGQILNAEFQIKWKFNKVKLVSGGGVEMDEYK